MNRFDQQWQKLTTLARQADDTRDVAAPYGFATRVAARAMLAQPASPWEVFERVALRGLVVAGVMGVAAFAFNFSATFGSDPWDDYAASDIVAAEMLDLS
ncbi:hypothetical protein [Oleiharenicola lentus]|uniref:hypothetical protein n=1 Tax=Oleiharenicola lentus TaxID=2508720 RepID=UPI003F67C77A